MDMTNVFILLAISVLGGIVLGYFLRLLLVLAKKGSLELEMKRIILSAKEEAQNIKDEAGTFAKELRDKTEQEYQEKKQEQKHTESRLIKKEELLDKRQMDIDAGLEKLQSKIEEVKELRKDAETIRTKERAQLEQVAQMSSEQAKEELLGKIKMQYEEDLLIQIRKCEMQNKEILDKKAQEIMTMSVQRMANSVSADILTTHIALPSDDIKGKIIGKEGRNIKAFEHMAGVELIVDDTPGTIIVSAFDPVRRQIARVALENLIADGRIQPVKIEEFLEKARGEVNSIIKQKGEEAVYECGIYGLDPRIVSILGRLYFRTSYGQNVLQHSIEMAHIAGVMAQELGADVQVAKAGALLHDIGKAVDHEVQGTHVEIGRRILEKFGADKKIIQAMQSHHEEYPYETLESRIVQAADAISGARPGARRDTVENHIKRLEDLESIGNSFGGVRKVYALQAGREVRVFVRPQDVSDMGAKDLARSIADRFECELQYPGEIRVHVIREHRVIEFAR